MTETFEHPAAFEPTAELISHIVTRYHATHRRELPELVALARKVERVHATDPGAPHGLADVLEEMTVELEVHMAKEEAILFPALTAGRTGMVAAPIAVMRRDHSDHEQALARIAVITHGFRLPAGACSSWARLYAGLQKLVEDLDDHMHLENDILFPRFEAPA